MEDFSSGRLCHMRRGNVRELLAVSLGNANIFNLPLIKAIH